MHNFSLSYDISNLSVSVETLRAFIGENRHIVRWLEPFPGLIFLKTNASAAELKETIRKLLPTESYFLVKTEPTGMAGYLSREMWEWLLEDVIDPAMIERLKEVWAEKKLLTDNAQTR
jgi:hypothetical protein